MNSQRKTSLVLVVSVISLLLIPGCTTPSPRGPVVPIAEREQNLADLVRIMSGSFSTNPQARAEPQSDRNMEMHITPIWTDRTDGRWLYVEQTMAAQPERPFRQRVYKLTAHPDGTLESAVFLIPADPLRYAGAWHDPARFTALRPENLTLRAGCSLSLRRNPDGSFAGGTRANTCASDLEGAAYATSDVMYFADRLVIWDRGFDASGKQVWGPAKGGYEFVRMQ